MRVPEDVADANSPSLESADESSVSPWRLLLRTDRPWGDLDGLAGALGLGVVGCTPRWCWNGVAGEEGGCAVWCPLVDGDELGVVHLMATLGSHVMHFCSWPFGAAAEVHGVCCTRSSGRQAAGVEGGRPGWLSHMGVRGELVGPPLDCRGVSCWRMPSSLVEAVWWGCW